MGSGAPFVLDNAWQALRERRFSCRSSSAVEHSFLIWRRKTMGRSGPGGGEARPEAFAEAVAGLEAGIALEESAHAWVSPPRTLFIFSGAGRHEAFPLSAEKLSATLHEGKVRVLAIDGVVGHDGGRELSTSICDAGSQMSI
jgi:hypothetical protein